MMRRRNKYRGHRVTRRELPKPGGPLKVDAIMTVCTEELAHELELWMPTAALHHPEAMLYVVGDYPAVIKARALAQEYHIAHRVIPMALLAGDGRKIAEERCRNVATISKYWKADVIWWKLEGLRQVLEDELPGRGVLLTDCDITFTAPVREVFPHADAVLSPFWWVTGHQVTKHPRLGRMPLAQRDGFFNAGYFLTNHAEVAKTWLELYEQGEGGFYEQKCLEHLPRRFRCDYFDAKHNWGKWRKETPRENVVSIHFHADEKRPANAPDWWIANQQMAIDAAAAARSALTGK